MVQILGLRDFVDQSGKSVKKECFFSKGWRAPGVEQLFANVATYLEQVPENQRYNLYYTVCECFEERGRKLERQRIIPFDIDDIDVEKIEETARTCLTSLGLAWEKTAVVFSGNGIQFLVGIKEPITSVEYFEENRRHYRALVDKLADSLQKAGLPGTPDPSVFSPARLMRMPDTKNLKPGRPERFARVVQGNIEAIDWNIREFAGIPDIGKDDAISIEVLKKYPDPDTRAVQLGCEFLKFCKAEPASIPEDQWYAMLSVVGRLENGSELAHEYSQGHPGYTPHETQMKLAQALEASGPRTCANINALWGKCNTCKFWGTKLTSPIMIRGPDYIKTKTTGFHEVKLDSMGNPRPGKPQYHDLMKYFQEKTNFITVDDSRIVYSYNGTHWEEVLKARLERFAQDNFEPKADTRMRQEFVNLVRCTNLRPTSWFERTSHRKMNMQNGVYDIQTHALTEHSQEYGFRYILPYGYDPKAKAPRFEQFLDEVTLGDKQMQCVLLEFMGYALSNDDMWLHKALILSGIGQNGKSTFIKALQKLGGEGNFANISLRGLNSATQRYLIDGKLFNIAEENSVNALSESDIFKTLVGGGYLTIKRLFVQEYEIRNRCKLIISCNELPKSIDKSTGLYRRMTIVPFDANFDPQTPGFDPHIDEKLAAELPGIFNLAMDGYRRLIARKVFTVSAKVEAELENYKLENDNVRAWREERLIETGNDTDSVGKRELYADYVEFCRERGEKPVVQTVFFKNLRHLLRTFDEVRTGKDGFRARALTRVQIRSDF